MSSLFRNSGIPAYKKMVDKITRLSKIEDSLKNGKICHLPQKGIGIFIGDLHGDLEAVVSIIRQADFLGAMNKNKDMFLVFLGDYGDRGRKTIETINKVLTLKLRYPENVVLLRGNHEEYRVAQRYGGYAAFMQAYAEQGESLFNLYCETMSQLPVVAITNNGIIGVHAGIPNQDINSINVLNDKNGEIYAREMTWNDPCEDCPGRKANERGKSITQFGEKAFSDFMKAVPAKLMVRSHEYFRTGVKLFFNNRLATIFSNGSEKSISSGYSGRVDSPVFLKVDLSKEKEKFTQDDFIEVAY